MEELKYCDVCGAPWPWEKSISQETHLELQAQLADEKQRADQAFEACKRFRAQVKALTAERDDLNNALLEVVRASVEPWSQKTTDIVSHLVVTQGL